MQFLCVLAENPSDQGAEINERVNWKNCNKWKLEEVGKDAHLIVLQKAEELAQHGVTLEIFVKALWMHSYAEAAEGKALKQVNDRNVSCVKNGMQVSATQGLKTSGTNRYAAEMPHLVHIKLALPSS